MNKPFLSKATINRPVLPTRAIHKSTAAKSLANRPCVAKPAPTWVELLGER
jgi:hypothetical protein